MPEPGKSAPDPFATKSPETGAGQTLAEMFLARITIAAHQCEEVEKLFAMHPAPELEALIKHHRVLVLQLATAGHANPALLKLSDQLTRTVLAFINAQTKAGFAERGMSLKEAQAAEARKDAETRALELCLEDAKSHPGVQELFKGVFNALRKIRTVGSATGNHANTQ